ncbi:unnamed protein product, partial [Iphiclides podalirius]
MSLPEPYYEVTARGSRVIALGGYRFSKHSVVGLKTRWFCGSHHSKGCKAVIFTVEGEIVKCNNTHNHQPVHARGRLNSNK